MQSLMQLETTALLGIVGTAAHASKGGYYYQDLATALAWARLEPGELLHVEIAEDYAVSSRLESTVVQVKHVANSLTLVQAVAQLERFLQIREQNPLANISFVYLTTADIGPERSAEHQPNGMPGIRNWEEVQRGERASELIRVLVDLAPGGSRLSRFLATNSEGSIVLNLIKKVTWATRAPDSEAIRIELSDRVAEIAYQESALQKPYGRRLWPSVVDRVTRASAAIDEAARTLTYQELRRLVREESAVVLPRDEYALLLDEARLAKALPLKPVNSEIERRLDTLVNSRFLVEANPLDEAKALAREVGEGGEYQIGDANLRSIALSWCARILIEADPQLAESLLEESGRTGRPPEYARVRALLLASQSKEDARRQVAHDDSAEAETIRYAIARKAGIKQGLEWLEDASVAPSQLDPGGQALVLLDLLSTQEWEGALVWLEKIQERAFTQFPFLHWAGAHVLLAWAVVDAARGNSLGGPPIHDELRLRDDPQAMAARRRSVELFRRFQPIAEDWGLSETAQTCLEYALGLQLEDRQSRTAAISEISRQWIDSGEDLHWLPLALRAGVQLDKDDLLRKLAAKLVRYGSLSYHDARAQLALLLHSKPETWLDQWPEIRSAVAEYFTAGFLDLLLLKGLIQADRRDQARDILAANTEISEPVRRRIELDLAQPDAQDIGAFLAAVEENGSPADLHNLVVALARSGDLATAADYSLRLFELTREHQNALELLSLLQQQGRWKEILSFIQANEFLLEQSLSICRMYVDALVRHGRWSDARLAADRLLEPSKDLPELHLQLSVSSGRWDEVGILLEEANANAELTSQELIRYGHVATNLGNISLAKQLVRRAVSIEGAGAEVYWNAYGLAVQGNWEGESDVRQWFQISLASADTEGSPVRSGSLAELRDMAPAWNEQTRQLERSVASGDMFLALAARQMNRPLASVMAGAAIANDAESDFRNISPIPAYAGVARAANRPPRTVALDASALLTLAQLNLLDACVALFTHVYLPHSVGVWLFTEASRARFHQPGQITNARRLLHSIARDEIKVTDSNTAFSKPLADEVGVDLAQLISACQADRDAGREAFVVRPTPLYRSGTLLEEVARVEPYQELLRSTLSIARSLQIFGGIEELDGERAVDYLKRHDQGWSNEGLVPQGARLYLDDLAVNYLQQVGLLKLLANARFDVVIHSDMKAQAISLGAVEDSGEGVGDAIEKIRHFYVEGQAQGKVSVLPIPNRDPEDLDDGRVEVTASVLLSQMFVFDEGVEAVVFDDRAVNRHLSFSYPNEKEVAVYTTLEVLGWLRDRDLIDDKQKWKCLSSLRRFGYLFIPTSVAELRAAVASSAVYEGKLFESVAAKAIRENLLLARASGMLQMPYEMAWYTSHVANVSKAIGELWSENIDRGDASAKSLWLFELASYESFADRMLGGESERRWVDLEALGLLRLLMMVEIPEKDRSAYNQWLDEKFMADLATGRPRTFSSLCELVRRNISSVASLVDRPENAQDLHDLPRGLVVGELGKQFVNHLPRTIRDVIFEDDELFEELGLGRSTVVRINIEGEPSFAAEKLYGAASVAHNTDSHVDRVLDLSGTPWNVEVLGDGVARCVEVDGGRQFSVAHSPLVSSSSSKRVAYAKKFAEDCGLEEASISEWLQTLEERPLSVSRISQLESDLKNAPGPLSARVRELLNDGTVSVSEIVPADRRYYERLVPAWQGEQDVSTYAARLATIEGYAGSIDRLLWSAHQLTSPALSFESMSVRDIDEAVRDELEQLDLWSLVGLVEALMSREDAFSELLETTSWVINHFLATVSQPSRVELSSNLFALVDSSISTSGLFADVPVFWRRFVSIAHAGLLERCVLTSEVEHKSFSDWAGSAFSVFEAATLADLFREPRWNGFLAHPQQLEQELCGRVLNALGRRVGDIGDPTLKERIFGEEEGALRQRINVFFSALPGPLEGSFDGSPPLPEDLISVLTGSLEDSEQPIFRRVLAASQLASMGRLPSGSAEELASAVESLDRLDVAAEAGGLLSIFCMRLSLAASATRNDALTRAVRRLLLGQHSIPLSLRLRAALGACGAESTSESWRSEVAHVLGRCVSLVRTRNDAEVLLFVLSSMRDVRLELIAPLAVSSARLQGLAGRLV